MRHLPADSVKAVLGNIAKSVVTNAGEGALQYVLGGISKLGGVSSKQLLSKVEGIENGLLRAAAALGIEGLSEVTEEELQLVLEPLYHSIVFGEAYDAPTVEEYWNS